MELQHLSEGGLQSQPDTILVKASDYVYQVWCEIALGMLRANLPLEQRQKKMFDELERWAKERYPQYGIIAFEDLSLKEAAAIYAKTGKVISWGMYVLLQKGGTMIQHSITALLSEGAKVIQL